MGAKHSAEPRTVRMENSSLPAGVIDVSDEVVARLKAGLKKQVKASAKSSSQNEVKSSKPATASIPPPAIPPLPKQPTIVYQNIPSTGYVGPGGLTVTAADVRRQKEEELKQNDALWRQRMSQLEENLKKTNTIMEQEYSNAMNDVRKRFATAPPTHQLPPCQDLKAELIACYRSNSGETLKCAEHVAAFRNCVNTKRIQKLDAEIHVGKGDQTVNNATAKGA